MHINQLRAQILNITSMLVGERAVSNLRMWRNFHYYQRAGIIFIHVPKAAGTSISGALYGRSLGHFAARTLHDYAPGDYGKLFSFGVLRHPVDRLISSYRYVQSEGTRDGWVANRQEYQECNFANLARFLSHWLPPRLESGNEQRLDNIFRPQADFVGDGHGSTLVDRLYRFEDLTERWPEIINHSLIQLAPLAHKNKNTTANRLRDALSTKQFDTILELYQRDYELWSQTT